MSKKKMLGSQVKQFISGVTAHGTEHLLELESDLVQTAILLAEAIEKLGASFFWHCTREFYISNKKLKF